MRAVTLPCVPLPTRQVSSERLYAVRREFPGEHSAHRVREERCDELDVIEPLARDLDVRALRGAVGRNGNEYGATILVGAWTHARDLQSVRDTADREHGSLNLLSECFAQHDSRLESYDSGAPEPECVHLRVRSEKRAGSSVKC